MNDAAAVESVFFAALAKGTTAELAAYLDSACAGDVELRRQVEKLLQAHPRVGDFLNKPVGEQLAAVPEESDATIGIDSSTPRKGQAPASDQAAGRTIDGGAGASDEEPLTFLAPPTREGALGRIGHYEVLQVLGKGGFGFVFRAFDEVLQRVVALKVLAPTIAATSPARKRFLREARSSAQVRHENVVQVYEVAEQPLPYLAMEFIPGETLQQKLDRVGPLEVPEVLRIARQIAEGLAAAHATDLIHRDIKPGNVLLEGGHQKVKITDFGLARAADDASISQSGIIAGTPMYMAPEQAQGQTLDQRADLFSLGSVLYQMVAGRPPFRANTTVAVLKRVAEDKPRAIREIIPETPQWLCDIIAKLHAKDPDDRYQSAREVADVLADCEAQLKANAKLKDYSRIPRGKPQRSGRRKWLAVAAAVLLSVIALPVTEFAGLTHLFRGREPNPIKAGGEPSPIQVAKQEPPPLGLPELVRDAVLVMNFEKDTFYQKDGKTYVRDLSGHRNDGLCENVAFTPDGKAGGGLSLQGGQLLIRKSLINHQADYTITAWCRSDKAAGAARAAGLPLFRDRIGYCLYLACLPADPRSPCFAVANYPNRSLGIDAWNFRRGGIPGWWRRAATDDPVPDQDWFFVAVSLTDGVLDTGKLRVFINDRRYILISQMVDAPVDEVADLVGWNTNGAVIDELAVFQRGLSDQEIMAIRALGLNGTALGPGNLAPLPAVAPFTDPERRAAEYLLSNGGVVKVNGQDQEIKAIASLPRDSFRLTGVVLWNADGNQVSVTDAGLAVFKDCKDLTEIKTFRTRLSDAGLANFKNCKNLTFIGLEGPEGVTDDGLAAFKDCKNLTFLRLTGAPLTGTGLVHFKDCKNLASLHLYSTQVSDAGLVHFKDCKNLTDLSLLGTQVSDVGLAHLAGLKALADLDLRDTKVTAKGVQDLAKALPKCKITWDGGVIEPTASLDPDRRAAEYVLSIGGTVGINGEDRGIGAKGDLPAGAFRLTHVGLSHNKQVTDSGLAVFEDCRNLTSFDLDGCPITDAGLAHFKDCKNLSIVWLEGVPVTDAALAVFAGNTNLSTLLMGHTKVTDAGLAHLKDCTNLSSLSLLYLPVTDAGLAHLKDCKKLKDLDLRNTNVTDAGLAYFKDCQDLTSLWVWGTITDAGLGYFKDCKNLKHLDLSTSSVTDAGLTILMEWAKLERLLLNGTKVSDAGLDHVKHCKNLKSLELRGTKVSAAGIETLAKALPQCEIEWDGGRTSPDRRAAEYVLSIGGSVRVDGNDREIKAVAELPKGALRLTIADLQVNKKVTDAGLAVFKDCQNLKIIYLLYAGQVTDAGLAHFKDCKTITQLHLQGTAVTDAGLAYFKDSKIITDLYLEGPKIADTGLAHFKNCTDMRILALLSTEVTDMGLAQVKDYKNLWCFVLHSTKVTDAGLLHLTGLQNLAILDLNETNVSDAGLAHLQACKTLTKVNLQKTKVTATGIDKLKQALPKCKIVWDGGVIEPTASLDPDRRAAEYVLSIGGNVCVDGNDSGIRAKPDLPMGAFRLSNVNVNHNKQVTDSGLAAFADCKNLTYLALYGCTQVTDAGLAHFKDCKGLMLIELEGVQLTDNGLATFKNCKNLTHVGLNNTQVTDAGLVYLKDCKNLTAIGLLNTQVTDAGLVHLKGCQNLEGLDLRGTQVTDTGLANFKDCKNLTSLNLQATKVTDAGLAYFKDWKDLSYLGLRGTSVTDAGLALFEDSKNLTELDLAGTSITDAGPAHLRGHKKLARLNLEGTPVTDAGLAHLAG